MTITLRPATPADEPFLYRVYSSTREDELALVDWDDAQKEAFLLMQHNAQHTHYHQYYPQASYDLILSDGDPVGRLYVDRTPEQIHIIDIALLPEYRNAKIGSTLLRELLDEARSTGTAVRIHVERFNPALRLYDRLGFTIVADHGVYFLMEWLPAPEEAGTQAHTT